MLLFLLCYIFSKFLHFDVVEKNSLLYSNAGNLIIPLVIGVLGSEWVIYTSAYICTQNILLWTHCQAVMKGELRFEWKKIFGNINMLSIFFGMCLFFLGLKLPALPTQAIKMLAVMIGPMSMLILGILLGTVQWNKIFMNKRIYMIALLKMVIFPMVILCFLKYAGLAKLVVNGFTILMVSLLAASAPSASMVTQLAQIYNRNSQYASAINVLTTLCCIVSMPLMIMLYEL